MRFIEIAKRYDEQVVFDGFSLTVPPQSIMAVVGPSGEGKTTLLHLASGLVQLDSGSIERDPSEEGPISYLFQEPRLLPKSTVFSNVELVLHTQSDNPQERAELATHYLELVGLKENLALYPEQLSGGMRQRVALARAFAHTANLMLLDEPFQSLDIKLRYSLIEAFSLLWEENPKTTLFVTHDPKEAILLGDTVLCLGNPKKPKLIKTINIPRSARNITDPVLLSYEAELVNALITP